MSEVEAYLAALRDRLRGDPALALRTLDEVADHLYAATEELLATGLARAEAERLAVQRFGPAEPVLRSLRRRTARALVIGSGQALVRLAGWGLVAVGLSGAVVAIFNAALGTAFTGALPGAYSPGACARLLAIHPGARGCSAAAVLENAQDAVSLRLLAGALGVLLLGVGRLWTGRSGAARSGAGPAAGQVAAPVRGLRLGAAGTVDAVDAVAAAAFAGGAVALIAESVDLAMRTGSGGVGFYLSGGVVAALAALTFGRRAVRAALQARVPG